MEVHHHTHAHASKNWKTYFWEFLMLFLAVFCGFLAEYQLEHLIERQREKEFMATMVEDLESDIGLLKGMVKNWEVANHSIDSVADAIQLPLSSSDMPKAYRHINGALNRWSFVFNDRTISQLKNSGGFRLLRNKKVSNKIIVYDQFNNDAYRNVNSDYNRFYDMVLQMRNKAFVQGIINGLFSEFEAVPAPAYINPRIDSMLRKYKSPYSNEAQTIVMFEFKNALLAYRKDFFNMKWGNEEQLRLMNELVELIKKEYHLES
jgi:hypothetical protein